MLYKRVFVTVFIVPLILVLDSHFIRKCPNAINLLKCTHAEFLCTLTLTEYYYSYMYKININDFCKVHML